MTSFENIESLCCYGHFSGADGFERMVESRREVWFGADGSGLLRSQFIRSIFFTDEQRARWQARHPSGAEPSGGPSDDVFAPGCWHGPGARIATISRQGSVEETLERSASLSLRSIKQLVGEALVPETLRSHFFDLCVGLSGAEVDDDAPDQLGRRGVAVSRVERDTREELIFDAQTFELLGTRDTLTRGARDHAPAGSIVGWTCFVKRQIVDALPGGVPVLPGPPCDPPGSGRGTFIRPGLTFGTGYLTDLRPQADSWLRAGIIDRAEHGALYAQQDEIDEIRRRGG